VLLGGLVLLWLDDGPEKAAWLTQTERKLLVSQVDRQREEIGEHSIWRALLMPDVLLLGFVYFLIQIASYGLNFWAPDLIKTAGGGNEATVGFLTAVPYVCGAVSMIIIGRLSDASGKRPRYVAGLIFAAAIGFFAAGLFDKNVVMLVAALAVLGAGAVAAIPTFWTLPPKLLTGAGAAAGIALINTIGQLGGIVSPVVVGAVKDATGTTTPALYLIGGLCIVCAILLLVAMPKKITSSDLSDH
jgi:MFS family permease